MGGGSRGRVKTIAEEVSRKKVEVSRQEDAIAAATKPGSRVIQAQGKFDSNMLVKNSESLELKRRLLRICKFV